jgi:hypothetical protein
MTWFIADWNYFDLQLPNLTHLTMICHNTSSLREAYVADKITHILNREKKLQVFVLDIQKPLPGDVNPNIYAISDSRFSVRHIESWEAEWKDRINGDGEETEKEKLEECS